MKRRQKSIKKQVLLWKFSLQKPFQKIAIGVLASIREKAIQENFHKNPTLIEYLTKNRWKPIQIDIIPEIQIHQIQSANTKAIERKISIIFTNYQTSFKFHCEINSLLIQGNYKSEHAMCRGWNCCFPKKEV